MADASVGLNSKAPTPAIIERLSCVSDMETPAPAFEARLRCRGAGFEPGAIGMREYAVADTVRHANTVILKSLALLIITMEFACKNGKREGAGIIHKKMSMTFAAGRRFYK